MLYVEKEPIAGKIREIIDHADSGHWKKARKIEIFTELLFTLEESQQLDTDNIAPDQVFAPSAKMIQELEPIVPYSGIGKDNYYCGHCKERVKRKDTYCRRCGFKFDK